MAAPIARHLGGRIKVFSSLYRLSGHQKCRRPGVPTFQTARLCSSGDGGGDDKGNRDDEPLHLAKPLSHNERKRYNGKPPSKQNELERKVTEAARDVARSLQGDESENLQALLSRLRNKSLGTTTSPPFQDTENKLSSRYEDDMLHDGATERGDLRSRTGRHLDDGAARGGLRRSDAIRRSEEQFEARDRFREMGREEPSTNRKGSFADNIGSDTRDRLSRRSSRAQDFRDLRQGASQFGNRDSTFRQREFEEERTDRYKRREKFGNRQAVGDEDSSLRSDRFNQDRSASGEPRRVTEDRSLRLRGRKQRDEHIPDEERHARRFNHRRPNSQEVESQDLGEKSDAFGRDRLKWRRSYREQESFRERQPSRDERGWFSEQEFATMDGDTSNEKRRDDMRKFLGLEPESESVKLFAGETLGIFTDQDGKPTIDLKAPVAPRSATLFDELVLEIRQKATELPPENAWEEMSRWTKDGKMPSYPINNEEDMHEETGVGFEDHVFLDSLLEGFPATGPVRIFMELVILGLSKNYHMTVPEKHEHVEAFRQFFKEKESMVEQAIRDQEAQERKEHEAEAEAEKQRQKLQELAEQERLKEEEEQQQQKQAS